MNPFEPFLCKCNVSKTTGYFMAGLFGLLIALSIGNLIIFMVQLDLFNLVAGIFAAGSAWLMWDWACTNYDRTIRIMKRFHTWLDNHVWPFKAIAGWKWKADDAEAELRRSEIELAWAREDFKKLASFMGKNGISMHTLDMNGRGPIRVAYAVGPIPKTSMVSTAPGDGVDSLVDVKYLYVEPVEHSLRLTTEPFLNLKDEDSRTAIKSVIAREMTDQFYSDAIAFVERLFLTKEKKTK